MIYYLKAWQSLKVTFPIRKSEWIMAGATTAMWLVFATNTTLFEDFRGMQPIARIAPQWVWSWFCFAAGVGRLTALLINGTHTHSPHARSIFAFLTCYLWYQLTLGLSDNFGIGMIFAGSFFITDMFNFKQALVEAATAEGLKNAERNHTARHSN